MKGLTNKQKAILDFIEKFTEKNTMAPTVYEIADYFKIKTSTVFAHIKALQRKNYLSRSSKARSISINSPKKTPSHMSFVLPVPLLGRINAGLPADIQEYKEGDIYCDKTIIGDAHPDQIFALRVHGESMRNVGIMDSDIVIIKQTDQIRTGDIVAALVYNETTIKSFYPVDDKNVELRPANSEFKTQSYPASSVSIQGKVIGLQRSYK